MPILFRRTNILDPYSWTTGSGGIGNFGQNGNTGENERVNGTDPFGNTAVVWESRPSGDNGADGGWGNGFYDVDEYSLYRWSVWVKRTSASTGGTNYFGLYGTPNAVIRIDNGAQEGNPYFECNNISAYTQDVWYLIVGHCFPSNYTGGLTTHPDSGRYLTSGRNGGINYCNIGGDVKWYPGTTGGYHRTYHYYCGDSTSRLQWFDPRLDKCDGSEPTISDLLNNRQAKLESTTVTVEGAALKHQKIVATGGVITTVGEYRVHRFNDSGTFTISSLRSGSIEVEYLIVAGGGGGGMDMGGGGGGGGVLNGTTILTPTSYTVTVGGGGTGAPAAGTNGQPTYHQFTIPATAGANSSFNGLTATGGGFGGSSYRGYTPGITGGNGGSGGGSSGYNDNAGTFYGGTGISGQGNRGGNSTAAYYSGGGGGAGAAGVDSTSRPDGGVGRLVGILGKPFYFSGGGGGSSYSLGTGGYGGSGGGGGGAVGVAPGGTGGLAWGSYGGGGSPNSQTNTPGGDGGLNTGGGGGGGSHYYANNKGGNGGKGIVIIRYKYI